MYIYQFVCLLLNPISFDLHDIINKLIPSEMEKLEEDTRMTPQYIYFVNVDVKQESERSEEFKEQS